MFYTLFWTLIFFNLIYLRDFLITLRTLHIFCVSLRSRCEDNIQDETPARGGEKEPRGARRVVRSQYKTDSEWKTERRKAGWLHLRLQPSLAKSSGSPQPESPVRGAHLPAMGLPQCPSCIGWKQPGRAWTPRKHPDGFQSQQLGPPSVAPPVVGGLPGTFSLGSPLFPETSYLQYILLSGAGS